MMAQHTRATWWLIEDFETEAGEIAVIVRARTWEKNGVRVDTPERVFVDIDEVPRASYEDGRFSEYALNVLTALTNEALARSRSDGQAIEITAPPFPQSD
jgi:hypothetical protein